MNNIIIKAVITEDIPIWAALSHEYDVYVRELVSDLVVWYEGDTSNIAFIDYMNAKIKQNEAFMAVDYGIGICLGIIAFSIKNNCITFFGVSHATEFCVVGNILMNCALNGLNNSQGITATILRSDVSHIIKQKRAFY